jgi:glycosyltransferase involved in cell wall biosynthesis
MKKRILILRSNPISPDPRVEKAAEALAAQNSQVVVLGWDRSGEKAVSSERPFGKLHLLSIKAGFGRGVGNLPQLLRWQWGLLCWLISHRREFDIIHACDFDTVLPALFVRVLWKKKVVYDIFDFYADHLRAVPRVVKAMIRIIDYWVVGRVDSVIVVDESRVEQIAAGKPRNVTVIYNSPQDLMGRDESWTIEKRCDDELCLTYVGLLHVERGLLELLRILSRRPTWSLDLAGFGGDEPIVVPKALSLPNVHFHGRISYFPALDLMRRADVLIATYDPRIPNHRYASPNKLFEAMMLKKPIVVAAGTNMDRIVEENNCGLIVPYGDVDELDRALSSLASDVNLRARLGTAGRRAYDRKYHWDIMRSRLMELYDKMETL